MSTFRKHFRVTWNDGEPVDIVTNAQDLADANEYTHNLTLATFALIHAALRRNHVTVPSLDEWIAQLDDVTRLNGTGDESLDPTPGMASTGEPSE